MGQNLCHFVFGHAVFPGVYQVELKRAVNQPLTHQGGNSENRAHLQGQRSFPAPDLTEEDVVVQFCEFGGRIPPVGLCLLFA